ncbi:hypothetical protein BegalDRAFT_0875 [Beggiatoa alba B18LD]|uniref:Endonuclease GajA/Old nuclease/RecF-like AAA domain-containing protein n=1 Tax=Beggiatoa alba B18LD TaxID=395493 RepID=I3CDU0_9GAMM|nr:AAA family ATPase [Beggiatoa alba]EIJ41783.1 hypothetical protein BegalDRAFT_0875 [Beggiatoa alba B18LD]
MNPSWTLEVEGFGKIKQASIAVKPLMLFVGDNNSGKSYLASLFWGVTEWMRRLDFSEDDIKTDIFLRNFLEQEKGKPEITITNEVFEHLLPFINKRLDSEKDTLIQRILNNQEINIKRLTIKNIILNESLVLYKDDHPNSVAILEKYKLKAKGDYFLLHKKAGHSHRGVSSPSILACAINALVIKFLFSLYFPASRTGFMLTYKSLIADSISSWGIDKEPKSRFSRPTIDFLQRLTKLEPKKDIYHNIAESLESEILNGQIISTAIVANDFSYQPQGTTQPLPLYLSSSLVTELAPLIIFLKYSSEYGAIILEEPEAHLHPAVQRILIRHLIKLVNRGIPVLITTHSDTIFQQVNNLISLYQHPKREKLQTEFGYHDDELIAPNEVSAYQFTNTPDGTDVEALKQVDGNGFAVPTFNQTILDLSKETIALQRD